MLNFNNGSNAYLVMIHIVLLHERIEDSLHVAGIHCTAIFNGKKPQNDCPADLNKISSSSHKANFYFASLSSVTSSGTHDIII